jgi:hypothetical protein
MLLQAKLRLRLSALPSATGWRAAWFWAAAIVAALRLGLALVLGVVWITLLPYLPAAAQVDPLLTGNRSYGPLAGALLGVWARWDALHYLMLARVGYFGVGVGDSVFYPLYPALIRFVALPLAGDNLLSALVVSSAACVVALAMLYLLAEREYGTTAARWAVLALAVYPTAFFLLAPFTESLFLALTLAAFVMAGERRWWLAGLLGAAASLARGPGLLTAAALGCIAWRQRAQWPATRLGHLPPLDQIAGLGLPVAGGAAFIIWRAWVGFPSLGSVLAQYSGLQLIDPVRGLALAVEQFVQVHDLPTTLDVVSGLLFCGMFAAMGANARWRKPEWLVYMALNLGTFLSKRSVQASSLQSLARYVLTLFPAFVVAGDWLAQRGPRLRFVYFLASSTVLLILAVGYSLWWFIG